MKQNDKLKLTIGLTLGIFFWLLLSSITLISAEANNCGNTNYYLGEFKSNAQIDLTQTCDDSSYSNLTAIKYPDGTYETMNLEMTRNGNNYNYTFSNTNQVGCYTYTISCDVGGIATEDNTDFKINGGMLGFIILAFILFFGLTFYGIILRRNGIEFGVWVSLIGCFGMLILGIYTSINGIDIYKDNLTQAISYVVIAIGLGIGFEAVRNILDL